MSLINIYIYNYIYNYIYIYLWSNPCTHVYDLRCVDALYFEMILNVCVCAQCSTVNLASASPNYPTSKQHKITHATSRGNILRSPFSQEEMAALHVITWAIASSVVPFGAKLSCHSRKAIWNWYWQKHSWTFLVGRSSICDFTQPEEELKKKLQWTTSLTSAVLLLTILVTRSTIICASFGLSLLYQIETIWTICKLKMIASRSSNCNDPNGDWNHHRWGSKNFIFGGQNQHLFRIIQFPSWTEVVLRQQTETRQAAN